MTDFPPKIKFLSDGNEAELTGINPPSDKQKEIFANYKYTKSKTKKNTTFQVSLEYLKRLQDSKLLITKK